MFENVKEVHKFEKGYEFGKKFTNFEMFMNFKIKL